MIKPPIQWRAEPGEGCFLCNREAQDLRAERLGAWVTPRLACGRCRARHPVLLETGESVEAFQARRPEQDRPSEGNLVDLFLNPVTVDGARAWACFDGYLGGGCLVFEELVPCAGELSSHAGGAAEVL
jgi:hypothetical protein